MDGLRKQAHSHEERLGKLTVITDVRAVMRL
jgi:hypothetical protein